MKNGFLRDAEAYSKQRKRKRRWYMAVAGLACVVILCTVYTLILPAITMENKVCELEEHTHSEECYRQITSVTVTKPVCSDETLGLHTHTAECFDGDGNIVCGYADFLVHIHNSTCYIDGELWCTLPEIEAHEHDESCYETDPETGEKKLICEKKEIVLHKHDPEKCRDEEGNLICGKLQILKHIHSEECFGPVEEAVDTENLTCTLPEDENHTHTALCYGTWELVCDKEEHTHDENCSPNAEAAGAEAVIALIDDLPEPDEARERLSAYDAGDAQGYNACLEELQAAVRSALEAYDGLTEKEQSRVTNIDRLTALEWLLDEQAREGLPALADDSAYVSELAVTQVTVGDAELAQGAFLHNGDTVNIGFSVGTGSYSDAKFGEGRVKLELVLPLSEEQAEFGLSDMTWMDSSAGYEPEVVTQTRVIGEDEIQCQVLTCYILLSSGESGESVIPGGFSGTVPVRVLDIEPGEGILLQISAAMEFGAWEGECDVHLAEEKLTVVTERYAAAFSEEDQQAVYDAFLEEIEALESSGEPEAQLKEKAEELLARLEEARLSGRLTEDGWSELYSRVYALIYGDVNTIAEAAEGLNWMLLRDSGWFEAYSSTYRVLRSTALGALAAPLSAAPGAVQPSEQQVVSSGGTNTSEDGSVSVSKTISGTELENVFDITLQVQTSMNITEITTEPDMAVVIVMDISNTMNSNFGDTTRYKAAMDSAEQFLEQFAQNSPLGISKVGYVAFNTDAHQIFGLQPCSNQQQVEALKNTMRTETGKIINAANYGSTHNRFTNIEAGLAMASDMLNGVTNKNKYIIFLSDGFPTTYIQSGYSGYDPYDSTGRFYDHVLNKKCLYGTSYSDEAAIRARVKAQDIKGSGTTIFSIGVDVNGQTIQRYITQSENADGFSVVDRTGTTYEIGAASDNEAYKTWLREKIGSGYYYDSTDSAGLSLAYSQIFEKIKEQVSEGSLADWVAEDPMPTLSGSVETVEFIGFYDKTPELVFNDLVGEHTVGGENTADFNSDSRKIKWDLKQSGYSQSLVGGTTTYTYTLVYRVRLENENQGFSENTVYKTNDTTTLQYRTISGSGGSLAVSEPKIIEFPIPSVKGYLAELAFTKTDSNGAPVAGAEFTLSHDTEHCGICRGNGSSVDIGDMVAVSSEDGSVSFVNIPSGHRYILTETRVPDGYSLTGNTYSVEVAYDQVTVTVKTSGGDVLEWNGEIENKAYYELPSTGGHGTLPYTAGGLLLLAARAVLLCGRPRRKGGGR